MLVFTNLYTKMIIQRHQNKASIIAKTIQVDLESSKKSDEIKG